MPIDGPFGWPTWPLDGVWNANNPLDAARIPHFYLMYGRPGATVPYGCDGGHNFSCWNYALRDVVPRMLNVLWHP